VKFHFGGLDFLKLVYLSNFELLDLSKLPTKS